MSALPRLIKFRELTDSLNKKEFNIFLNTIIASYGRKIIVSSLFSYFNNKISNENIVHKMNDIIHQIIKSRHKNEQQDSTQLSLPLHIEHLSKHLLGEISSYLSQRDYANFSRMNRSIYISINSPNKLQQIQINDNNFDNLKFEHYPMIKSLYFIPEQFSVNIDIDEPNSIIDNLLNTNYSIIRFVMKNYFISTINKMVTNTSKRRTQINTIISVVLEQLNKALQIASDESNIYSSNEAFPDDLKNYNQRLTMLSQYLKCLFHLIQLFPDQIVSKLVSTKIWKLLIDLFCALENGSESYCWAVNEDKLIVMEIMIYLIDVHNIDPKQLFDTKLINALTSQFLISTRSDVVSPHMEQVVSITYRLLTHFAFEEEDEEEDEDDDIMNKRKSCKTDNWIANKIVGQHWFLWTLSDICIPHNVFQSSIASNAIFQFLEKIINYKCMKNGTEQMIQRVVDKWEQCSQAKTIEAYPRDTIIRLLMLILNDERGHLLFITQLGQTVGLMKKWIETLFFTDLLNTEDEKLKMYHIALDFFQFHIDAAIKYSSLQTEMFAEFIKEYISAILSVFMYYAHKKDDMRWNEVQNKALSLLELIFDLEKSYGSEQKIVEDFLSNATQKLNIFASPVQKSALSMDWIWQERKVTIYFADVFYKGSDIESTLKRIQSENGWMKDPQYLNKLCPVLKTFFINYRSRTDFNYEQCQNSILSLIISCWFLQIMGNKLPDIIEKHIKLYLDLICKTDNMETQFEQTHFCWISWCILMTSNSLDPKIYDNELNMRILRCLTFSACNYKLIDTNITWPNLLQRGRKKTLTKYLPAKFDICIKEIHKHLSSLLSGSDVIYTKIEANCMGYIEYFWNVLNDNKSLLSTMIMDNNPTEWHNRKAKLDKLTQILTNHLENDNYNANSKQMQTKLVKYFTIISEWIDKEMVQCLPELNKKVIINVEFLPIQSQVLQVQDKLKDNDSINIEMSGYLSCQELIIKIQSEVAKRCDNESFSIKGCIHDGRRIDDDKVSIWDTFMYPKKVKVVYELNDNLEATQ